MKVVYKLTVLAALGGKLALHADVEIDETIFENNVFDWRACYNGSGFCAGTGFVSVGNVTTGSGASVTVKGTTDTTGALATAHENLAMTAASPSERATANATGSLSTGTVRFLNTAGPFGSPVNQFPESFSHVTLTDNVHFTVANPQPSGTPIQVTFTLDGKMSCPSDGSHVPGDNYAYTDASLIFGGTLSATIDCDLNTASFLSTYPGANGESGWAPGAYLNNTPQLI